MNKSLLASALLLALLAGCANERVILLPSADGRQSAVVVRTGGDELLLDKPYAANERRIGLNIPYQSNAAEVQERYAATLAAQPMRPSSYTLYFMTGSNQLTPASEAEFARIKSEIAQRAASEARVIGHTDRVGSAEANDRLSKVRAERVRDLLVSEGVAADKLEAVGRGEREPLVPTADEVDEARNRRVEIAIR
ncbi:MAG: OmpA family protein [Dechloromonas sp.]|nr:OmpA family protein [Dechloromonas sp.]